LPYPARMQVGTDWSWLLIDC